MLFVEDDGYGFHPIGSGETLIGLIGMRERAAAVGGTIEIEPTPDGGTTVLARIPLSTLSAARCLTAAVGAGRVTPSRGPTAVLHRVER